MGGLGSPADRLMADVIAAAGAGGPTTANFTMTFAPTVPIPAAVWLFVTGLWGLRRWLPKSSVAVAT